MQTAVIGAGAGTGRAPAARTVAPLARALGWFSVGLGVASLIMPRSLARSAGIAQGERWVRAIGTREVIAGAGILMRPHQPGWLWARVAGDAMDLGLIALAAWNRHPVAGRRLGVVSAALTGVTVLDLLVAWDHTNRLRHRPSAAEKASVSISHVKKSLDVNRSPEECYRFWREFENFPRFMSHVDAIVSMDGTHSRWQVRGPLGQMLHWETELTSDVPGHQLGWQTTAGSEITHTGRVRFCHAPGQRGTRLEVEFTFHPPLGKTGIALARVTGNEPSQQVSEDLRRFKQLIETGEIPTTIGQPAGRRSVIGRLVHKGFPG